jgi:hypothetical protein
LGEDRASFRTVGSGRQHTSIPHIERKKPDALLLCVFAGCGSSVEDHPAWIKDAHGYHMLRDRKLGHDLRLAHFRVSPENTFAAKTMRVVGRASRTAVPGVIEPAVITEIEPGVNLAGRVILIRSESPRLLEELSEVNQ